MINRQLPLSGAVENYLQDLQNSNYSSNTLRVYKTDLHALATCFNGSLNELTADILRTFFAQFNDLRPATRARKQASVAGFLKWALRQELIDKNPLVKLKRVKVVPSSPQGLSRQQVGKILKIIPKDELRDRLLFGLLFETGLRISEALSLYVEDVDLTPDDCTSSNPFGQKRYWDKGDFVYIFTPKLLLVASNFYVAVVRFVA